MEPPPPLPACDLRRISPTAGLNDVLSSLLPGAMLGVATWDGHAAYVQRARHRQGSAVDDLTLLTRSNDPRTIGTPRGQNFTTTFDVLVHEVAHGLLGHMGSREPLGRGSMRVPTRPRRRDSRVSSPCRGSLPWSTSWRPGAGRRPTRTRCARWTRVRVWGRGWWRRGEGASLRVGPASQGGIHGGARLYPSNLGNQVDNAGTNVSASNTVNMTR